MIKSITKEYKLKSHIYSISDLKDLFNSEIRNKKFLAEHLTFIYPELTRIYLREKENRNQYYLRVFEAVAAVTHCYNKVK